MRRLAIPLALVVLAAAALPARASHQPATFSVVAFDSITGEVGVAVESKYFSVGRVVPWVMAGVGAVATQANVQPSYGPRALKLLESGQSPEEVLRALSAGDSSWDSRQLGVVDAYGRTATWTGPRCGAWAGGESGVHFVVQGNLLAGAPVVAAMAKAMRESREPLAGKLIAALEAAQAAGGDKRGQQSAALIVGRPSARHPEFRERWVDLRVEDHRTPIAELRRVWRIHQGFHGAGSHMQMAREYDAAGDEGRARRERERVHEILVDALKRGERDAGMLNGLAWSCAIHDLNLPDALKAAERAAALEPKSADILDTLAEVHFRMGQLPQAVAVGRRALALDPKSVYLQGQVARFEKAGQP